MRIFSKIAHFRGRKQKRDKKHHKRLFRLVAGTTRLLERHYCILNHIKDSSDTNIDTGNKKMQSDLPLR